MKGLLSLIVLSYKRPEMLKDCIDSIRGNIDFPTEIIVGDDTSQNAELLLEYLKNDRISKLILNSGRNRGIGMNLQNCLGVAEGEYVLKTDADIVFQEKWAHECIGILENNPDVATLNLFNYSHYDENDTRFKITEERSDCYIVSDFVNSCYLFRKSQIPVQIIPDDGMHGLFYGKKAITKRDLVKNVGFGIPASVYVTLNDKGEPVKTETGNHPLIIV